MLKHPVYQKYGLDENTYDVVSFYKKGTSEVSDEPQRIIKKSKNNHGYLIFSMIDRKFNLKKPYSFHRFVWECFNQKKIPEGLLIRHYDDNKLNNNISNLLLGNHKDNYADAKRNGSYEKHHKSQKRKDLAITMGKNNAREWIVTHISSGEKFEVKNLHQWCQEKNVIMTNLVKTARGLRNQCSGYKAEYKDGPPRKRVKKDADRD